MPLQKQLVPVDVVAGLDTKNDPKLTPALTDLKNGRYTVGSQISKRLGYTALSQTISGTTDLLDSGEGITSFQDELLEFSNSKLYSYSSSVERWIDKGGFQSVSIDSDDIIRNTSEARNQDSCIASGLQLFAWEQYSVAGVLEGIFASVLDSVSGGIIQAATLIDATAINPRCIRLGPNPTLCYLDTSASPHLLKSVQVDTNNPVAFKAAKTISSVVNNTNPVYDVQIYSDNASSGNGIFCYNNSGSTRIDVGYITTDGAVGTAGSGFPVVETILSTNATDCIAICGDKVNTATAEEERIYVGYASTGSSAGLKIKRITSQLAVEATHTVEGTATKIDGASMLVTQAGDLQIIYTLNATNTYDHQCKGAVYDISADSMGSAAVIKRSVGLVSKLWEYDSEKYFIAVHDSGLQPTYFVMNTDGLISAKILPGTSGPLPAKFLASVDSSVAGIFKFGGLVRTRLTSKNNDLYSLTGISNITIDFTSVERFEAAELGGNLHIGGGYVSMYDSQQIVELNYHLYPENLSAAINNSAGSLAAGTYLYQVIWFWVDAKGQDHRSAPSVAVSAAPSGGSSTVTLTIPSLRLTQKTDVICEVYRTVTVGRLFFKIGKVANNTAADSITFADAGAISDADLVAKESLYTNGGIIENIPPPASLVLTNYKNRLVCVSSENPKKLLYSKKRQPLSPVEFSDVFSIVLNKAIRITALAEFDQKLIVFEPNQIFYITGNGPNSTGAQNDFSAANLVTGDVGCSNTNSLVLMPLGLMFQSNKGIYLLNRSLETIYIGAEVEAYNSLTITSAELIQNENQIRYLTSDGRALIYDYFYGKWSTWTNHQGNGATTWQGGNGDYVYLRTDGRIFQQSATSYKDANDPIEMSLTTSWVKTNGIQGFQRVRRAFVLGDFKSTHTLQLEIGHNYQEYFNELHKFNYITDLEIIEYGDSTPYGDEGFFGTSSGVANGVYQFRAHCKKQKCQSIRFRISDTEEAEPGQAYSISSLMLEVGIRANTMKLPAQKLT